MAYPYTIRFDKKFSMVQRRAICAAPKFDNYCKQLEQSCIDCHVEINEIYVENVKWFHPPKKAPIVGFIYCDIEYIDLMMPEEKRKPIVGYVVIRGNAVTALVTINKKFGVYVEQFRLGKGKRIREPPAGMVDNSGEPKTVMIDELAEECGIDLKKKYPEGFERKTKELCTFDTSQGLIDEGLKVYWLDIKMDEEDIQLMLNKVHGEKDSMEAIKVGLFDLADEQFVYGMEDCKMLIAYNAFRRHLRESSKRESKVVAK